MTKLLLSRYFKMIECTETRLEEQNKDIRGKCLRKKYWAAWIGGNVEYFPNKRQALDALHRWELKNPPEGCVFVSTDTNSNKVNYLLNFESKTRNGWYKFSNKDGFLRKFRADELGFDPSWNCDLSPIKTKKQSVDVAHWLFSR